MKRHESGTTLQPPSGRAEQTVETARPAQQKVTASRLGRLTSTKVHERHLARLAIVYVRQSSPQQVMENRESRERRRACSR